MGTKLPEAYWASMKQWLGDEFADFVSSYEQNRHYGLRVNSLKLSADEFLRLSPFPLQPIPWIAQGFYFAETERPGKHPYYHAGLYYIQEPSAMLPAELLDVRPGDRVLDLCAAPGGKTTQIAAKLQGTGVLVANDPHAERVKALVKNIELAGVRGAVVLNERPERLIGRFAGYFDKILLDAPCSGEGMFRKEPDMAKEWRAESAAQYAVLQRELLSQAAQMLAPGGRIVYSTCTFAPEENERTIAAFLRDHPRFRVEPAPLLPGFAPGRADALAPGTDAGIAADVVGAVRLWPHRVRGEGHFAAVLRHDGPSAPGLARDGGALRHDRPRESGMLRHGGRREPGMLRHTEPRIPGGRAAQPQAPAARPPRASAPPGLARADADAVAAFAAEQRIALPAGPYVAYGDRVYCPPPGLPDLAGLKVARPGWHIGGLRRGRFVPSHALALGLAAADAGRTLPLDAASAEVVRYLKGETLEADEARLCLAPGVSAKGYVLVTVDGYPLGFGKWQDGILKNEYPPAWRWS